MTLHDGTLEVLNVLALATGVAYAVLAAFRNRLCWIAGAVSSVERIVLGLRLEKKSEPIVALKEVTPEILQRCEELGAAFAAGLSLGVF